MNGFALRIAALCVAALAGAVPVIGQSFDNFDGETLDGFDLSTDDMGLIEVPSLSDDNGLGVGPDIELQQGTSSDTGNLQVLPGTGTPVTSVAQPETEAAARVVLRALDKTLGRPTDIEMAVGDTVIFGRIAINLLECRYPSDDPALDAFAYLQVFDLQGNRLFDGWMVASSPALNALEHARYDVWVLRCETPS